MIVKFKESEVRRYYYGRSVSIQRIKDGKVFEKDGDEIFEILKKYFDNIFTFEDDILPKHRNGKTGQGRYLMVINDKVIYRKGRPYWLGSIDSCKSFLISILNNYQFKKELNLPDYLYHQTIHPADILFKDMEESDFIEIFKYEIN